MEGTQFHISVLIFRKTCPLSLAGAVISTSEYSLNFDQVFMVMVLVQSGLITVIVMVPWLDSPRVLVIGFLHDLLCAKTLGVSTHASRQASVVIKAVVSFLYFSEDDILV